MLLRSITKHVKDQNWFAVGIDFAIVVIGVFIGIQVANWNGARQESKLKVLIEDRLIADFQMIDEELDAAVERMESQLISLEVFRKAILRRTENPEEKDAIVHALSRGFSYPRFTRQSVTYQELQTSGRLDLISNEALRVVLAEFDQNQQGRRLNLRTIRDGLVRNGFRAGEYTSLQDLERDEDGNFQIADYAEFDFEAMVSDPKYIDRIEATLASQTWIHSNVRWARRDADAVLAVIEGLK
ncbi:MAG: hypothetical protein AAF385_01405 [Pseudomonadota bacterium]